MTHRLYLEGAELGAALIAAGLLTEPPDSFDRSITQFRNVERLPIRIKRPNADDISRAAQTQQKDTDHE